MINWDPVMIGVDLAGSYVTARRGITPAAEAHLKTFSVWDILRVQDIMIDLKNRDFHALVTTGGIQLDLVDSPVVRLDLAIFQRIVQDETGVHYEMVVCKQDEKSAVLSEHFHVSYDGPFIPPSYN